MPDRSCYHDQRKLKQVIDEIGVLAHNLEDLRAEVNALKDGTRLNHANFTEGCCERSKCSKFGVFRIVKTCVKKIKDMVTFREREPPARNQQQVFYACTNLSSELSTFLFQPSNEDTWRVPEGIKYLKNQGNQTETRRRDAEFISPCDSENPRLSHLAYVLQCKTPFRERASKRVSGMFNKIIFPQKNAMHFPTVFEINSETNSHTGSSIGVQSSSDIAIVPCSWNIQPENVDFANNSRETRSTSGNPSFLTKSTQTDNNILFVDRVDGEMTRKRKRSDQAEFRQPKFYFAKLKNAMVKRDTIGNLNRSKLTYRKYNCTNECPYLLRKECCKGYICNIARKNDIISKIGGRTPEKDFFQEFGNNYSVNNDNTVCQNFYSDEELDLPSSTSVSLDLELNVYDNNNVYRTDDSPRRKKPRTYVINNVSREYNRSFYDRFEGGTICVQHTSAQSFSSGCQKARFMH